LYKFKIYTKNIINDFKTKILCNNSFINTLFAALMREYQNEDKRFQKQLERTVEIEIIRAGIFI